MERNSGFFTPGPRVLIAEPARDLAGWLDAALEPSRARVTRVATGGALQEALFGGGFQVVVANARLNAPTALQVLAQSRAAGLGVPFVVVCGFAGALLQVYVGEPDGSSLVSRLVDERRFAEIVARLALGDDAALASTG